ncbi:MAG: tRNA1(Val) (adenine(37)-N6)-methyltransferase [Coprobacillus sp.]|nr:tRNA1(Val) (adenine(37)-N6)-methyltransferase [Coprobacillus sp.]MDY4144632.1 tRNA1(Val) (adenine(37)-N6)-methyltransferase [Bacilli bacterium]
MINNGEKIHELLGYENIKIIQKDDVFSFSLDSMLLANFIDANKAQKIIDLGTGNAPIPLFLTLKTNAKIYGIEIQEEPFDLAQRSVELNHLENQITIIKDDLKGIYKKLGANTFDIVCSNPPYFKVSDTSIINKNDTLTIARHEVKANVNDIIEEASKLLVDGGKLYIIHRIERMPEIIKLLENKNFGIKRMQLIYPKEDGNAYMFIIESKKNKKTDLKIIKPLVVHNNGRYTDEVLKIFNFKKTC